MEDEEKSITDANNVTDDTFSHASSSQIENADVIFTSEKLDKSDELLNAINKLTTNEAVYELSKATTSDAQGDVTSNPDTINHISNIILDETLLSCRTIGEVPVHPPHWRQRL